MSEPHGDSRQTTRIEDQKIRAGNIRDAAHALNKAILHGREIGLTVELDVLEQRFQDGTYPSAHVRKIMVDL